MADPSGCTVILKADGSFHLTRTTPPNAGATIARITPARDKHGAPSGWRLVPLVTLHGAKNRVWETPAHAIAATRLMTVPQARRAVSAAEQAARPAGP